MKSKLAPLRRVVHPANDQIDAARLQVGRQSFEAGMDELGLQPELGGDRADEVDVEADKFVRLRIDELHGRMVAFGADHQLTGVLDVLRKGLGGGAASNEHGGEGRGYQNSDFTHCSLFMLV